MTAPASSHFIPVDLAASFNADRDQLRGPLGPPPGPAERFGMQVLRGFDLGPEAEPNVALVAGAPVAVELADPIVASYVLFLHVVETRNEGLPADLAEVPEVRIRDAAIALESR